MIPQGWYTNSWEQPCTVLAVKLRTFRENLQPVPETPSAQIVTSPARVQFTMKELGVFAALSLWREGMDHALVSPCEEIPFGNKL